MQAVRIYEIPDCKMVSSGPGMFGQEKFERFHTWFSSLPRKQHPGNYLYLNDRTQELHWLQLYEKDMTVPDEFEIIDFKGGLYAVSTDIDNQTDMEAINKAKNEFFKTHGFEIDESRLPLGNTFTPSSAEKVMGYTQMDYYTPIKIQCTK